jgi:putative transposase
MARKRFGPEQVVTKLRQVDVLMGEGKNLQQAVREAGITDATYDRWRKEYGGLKGNQAKRLKDLERENGRLKKRVADLSLEKAILKDVAEGNF